MCRLNPSDRPERRTFTPCLLFVGVAQVPNASGIPSHHRKLCSLSVHSKFPLEYEQSPSYNVLFSENCFGYTLRWVQQVTALSRNVVCEFEPGVGLLIAVRSCAYAPFLLLLIAATWQTLISGGSMTVREVGRLMDS